jgi:hypothetical protein
MWKVSYGPAGRGAADFAQAYGAPKEAAPHIYSSPDDGGKDGIVEAG